MRGTKVAIMLALMTVACGSKPEGIMLVITTQDDAPPADSLIIVAGKDQPSVFASADGGDMRQITFAPTADQRCSGLSRCARIIWVLPVGAWSRSCLNPTERFGQPRSTTGCHFRIIGQLTNREHRRNKGLAPRHFAESSRAGQLD